MSEEVGELVGVGCSKDSINSVKFYLNELELFEIEEAIARLDEIIEEYGDINYLVFEINYPYVGFDPETGGI